MKTKLLLAFLVVFCFSGASAQAPNWLWATAAGGISAEVADAVCTDASGNVYATGYFSSSSITFGSYTLTTSGSSSLFVVKMNAAGTYLWAKSAGGSGSEYSGGISADASGNVIVSGQFASSSITFGSNTLTNVGGSDMFTVKYDATGAVLWATSAGSAGTDYGVDNATDASGNVFVAGYFSAPSVAFGSTVLNNAGGFDVFLAKYNSSGALQWVRSAGDTIMDIGIDVTTDASGNSYFIGYFTGPGITFGSTALTNTTIQKSDIFLVKYDPTGSVLWARSGGSTGDDHPQGITSDNSGNIMLCGQFEGTATLGAQTLNTAGNDDIFVAQYDASGNIAWARSGGGTGDEFLGGIALDANGNSYVAGGFASSSMTFGSTTVTNTSPTFNIFIAKLAPGPTGLEPLSGSHDIRLYPNPVGNLLHLQSKSGIESAEIYSMDGSLVRSVSCKLCDEFTIEMTGLAAGAYALKTYTKKGVLQSLILKD